MMSRTRLAWVIGLWAVVVWGGRTAILLDTGASPWDRGRVGLSVVLAAAVVTAFATGRLERPIAVAYALGTVLVWGRSLVSVWTGDESVGFVAVHTVLASVSLLLAALAVRATLTRSPDRTRVRQRTG